MYDFDTCPDRRNASAYKYINMLKKNPEIPEGIIPMSVADMEFKNAPEIVDGLKDYIEKTVLGYTAPTDSFFNAFIDWQKRRHNYDIEKEWIKLSDGVVPALCDLIKATTHEGDGVIILTPVYYPFRKSIEMNGRKVVDVNLITGGKSYMIDFDALEKAASDENTKLIIFCNPHNPVGRVWTRQELLKVYQICVANNVFIIDDEIHNDLIMPGYEHTVMAKVAPDAGKHMAVCVAASKTFNLAALQTSMVIIEDSEIRKAFDSERFKGYRDAPNPLGIEASRLAYTHCENWLDECIKVIHDNSIFFDEFMKEHFPEVVVYPMEGTYLKWCDFSAWKMPPKELEKFMTEEALLFLDEGYWFGTCGAGFERFNLACPKHVIEQALTRLLNAKRYK